MIRDIYEVANQLGGYVGPNTPDDLAKFLLREADEASKLADEIVRLRADCKRKDELLTAAVDDYNDARSLAIEECARYHDDLAAQHAAAHENVVSDHHEMMERQHRRDAAAIRRIKPSEAEGKEG